jgi:hypothetical protein
MSTFAPKQSRFQTPVSPGHPSFRVSKPVPVNQHSGQQRQRQRDQASPEVPPSRLAPNLLGHDFSDIPVAPSATETIQTRLAIDQPGDEFEREADRIAQQVAGVSPYPAYPANRNGALNIQRLSGQANAQTDLAPESVALALASPGMPLAASLRQDMEHRFGHDFSSVRVHSGPLAEQSASDLSANAYTVGRDIVFGAGTFTPGTQEGRKLLAHELTHVLQQNGPRMQAPALTQTSLLQRDKKDADPKKKEKKADPKLEAAKKSLQDKFGLKAITEEDDAPWTESQLKSLDKAFSKMSIAEQEKLKGVTVHRVKKIESPEGLDKKITIVGETFGTNFMQFTAKGFTGNTPLHEAGHIIRNSGLQEIGSKSKFAADEDAARKQVMAVGPRAMIADMNALRAAAIALRDSDDASRDARARDLEDAQNNSFGARMSPEIQSDSNAKEFSAAYDRLDKWVDTIKALADAKAKAINEFIALVKANKLARKGFRPFTDYVAFNWPAKPNEFLVECYATWRNDPDYMRVHAKPLFNWFEAKGHLVPKTSAAGTP